MNYKTLYVLPLLCIITIFTTIPLISMKTVRKTKSLDTMRCDIPSAMSEAAADMLETGASYGGCVLCSLLAATHIEKLLTDPQNKKNTAALTIAATISAIWLGKKLYKKLRNF